MPALSLSSSGRPYILVDSDDDSTFEPPLPGNDSDDDSLSGLHPVFIAFREPSTEELGETTLAEYRFQVRCISTYARLE
jgi:hypothetical protein